MFKKALYLTIGATYITWFSSAIYLVTDLFRGTNNPRCVLAALFVLCISEILHWQARDSLK